MSYEGVISFFDFQPSHAAPKGLVKLMIFVIENSGFCEKEEIKFKELLTRIFFFLPELLASCNYLMVASRRRLLLWCTL